MRTVAASCSKATPIIGLASTRRREKLAMFAQVGVHCYSSKDLYNWKDEGIALSVSDDESSPIVKGCILERPKVIFNKKTGKYVMWFHLEPKGAGYSGAQSGVAVSDKVTGPLYVALCRTPERRLLAQKRVGDSQTRCARGL